MSKLFKYCFPIEIFLKQPSLEYLCNLKGGVLNMPI